MHIYLAFDFRGFAKLKFAFGFSSGFFYAHAWMTWLVLVTSRTDNIRKLISRMLFYSWNGRYIFTLLLKKLLLPFRIHFFLFYKHFLKLLLTAWALSLHHDLCRFINSLHETILCHRSNCATQQIAWGVDTVWLHRLCLSQWLALLNRLVLGEAKVTFLIDFVQVVSIRQVYLFIFEISKFDLWDKGLVIFFLY